MYVGPSVFRRAPFGSVSSLSFLAGGCSSRVGTSCGSGEAIVLESLGRLFGANVAVAILGPGGVVSGLVSYLLWGQLVG